MQQIPVHLRKEASECLCYEASCRIKDPVYGCLGIISMLQQEIIKTETEIVKIKAEIAIYNAQQHQYQQDQQIILLNDQVHQQQGYFSNSNSQQYSYYGFNEFLPNNDDI